MIKLGVVDSISENVVKILIEDSNEELYIESSTLEIKEGDLISIKENEDGSITVKKDSELTKKRKQSISSLMDELRCNQRTNYKS